MIKKKWLFNEKRAVDQAEKKLYAEWEVLWKKECKDDEIFLELFKANYNFVLVHSKTNRNKNFFFKGLFSAMIFIAYAINFNILFMNQELKVWMVLNVVVFLGFSLGLAKSIEKWIGIKKFQETWVRHSTTRHQMLFEMYKYIVRMDPYERWESGDMLSDKERVLLFKKRILKIWQGTQQKFEENMLGKEEKLHFK